MTNEKVQLQILRTSIEIANKCGSGPANFIHMNADTAKKLDIESETYEGMKVGINEGLDANEILIGRMDPDCYVHKRIELDC